MTDDTFAVSALACDAASAPFTTRRARRAAERLAETQALVLPEVLTAEIVEETPVVVVQAVATVPAATPVVTKARAAKPARRQPRSFGRFLLSAAAMTAAGAFLVSLSLPGSAAFGTIGEREAAALVAPTPEAVDADSQDLRLTVTASEAVAVADSFGSQSNADVIRAMYQAAGRKFQPSYVPTAGSIRWPFPSQVVITAPYGYSNYYAFGWHSGIDFAPGRGAAVQAIADGVVTWVGWDSIGHGYNVIVEHRVDGQKVTSLYAHMIDGSSELYPGQEIKVGTVVGKVGSTGLSTGDHLHLAISVNDEPTDPYVWLSMNATDY